MALDMEKSYCQRVGKNTEHLRNRTEIHLKEEQVFPSNLDEMEQF